MASRELARSNVAVVPLPKKPNAGNVAPMLESLARLGMASSDISVLSGMMRDLRRTSRAEVGKAVLLHTKRFAEGYYAENDPDQEEVNRMNAAITLSIYLIKSLEMAYKAAGKQCNTGVTSLVETAVDEVSRVLTPEFFKMDRRAVYSAVINVLPFVHAGLNAAKLPHMVKTLPEAFLAHREDTLRMIETAHEKIYGPEEAA